MSLLTRPASGGLHKISEAYKKSRFTLLAEHPLSTYYLIMGSTLLLLSLGLVMVLSASSVESVRVFGSAYVFAQRQALFGVCGVIALIFALQSDRHCNTLPLEAPLSK